MNKIIDFMELVIQEHNLVDYIPNNAKKKIGDKPQED